MSKKDKQAPAKNEKEDESSSYHYTSKDSLKKILDSGKIKASEQRKDDDVTFGANKTYFTSRHPEKNTPLEIATNNYDGTDAYAKSKLSSTEVAIKFNTNEIGAEREKGNRSIYTVKGNVDIAKAEAIYERKGDQYKLVPSKPE